MDLDKYLGVKLTHVVRTDIERWHDSVRYIKAGTIGQLIEDYKPSRLTVVTDENNVIEEMRYG